MQILSLAVSQQVVPQLLSQVETPKSIKPVNKPSLIGTVLISRRVSIRIFNNPRTVWRLIVLTQLKAHHRFMDNCPQPAESFLSMAPASTLALVPKWMSVV